MEFSIDDLNRIIISLFNEPFIDVHNNSHSSSTTEQNEQSILNEQQTSITIENNSDREYCLIIFNNSRWSQCLRKRSPSSQVEQQQQQQMVEHETNHTEGIVVKSEPKDVSLDDLFIAQLRQLINDYMLRTKRPFPIKYFLDFTTDSRR